MDAIKNINTKFKKARPEEILTWCQDTFSEGMVMTSSFQTQSVPLIHLVAQFIPNLPVLFLDTGFHFAETLEFKNDLKSRFNLNIREITSHIGHQNFKQEYGNLYGVDPDLCCHINKTQPLQEALKEYKVWIAGVRGDQTNERKQLDPVNILEDGTIKICPLINWTKKDLWTYINKHDLPSHPLFHQGYMSIGCAPCTRAIKPGEDERAGRWEGQCKTECGIHTNIGKQSN